MKSFGTSQSVCTLSALSSVSLTSPAEEFETRHAKPDIEAVLKIVGEWESWDDTKAYFKAGPPPFLREGWVSPLVGQKIDLSLLDDDAVIRWVNGPPADWKNAKSLLIVFWAT